MYDSNKEMMINSYIDISGTIRKILGAFRRLGWIVFVLALAAGGILYMVAKKNYVPVYTAKGTFAVSVSASDSAIPGYYNNAKASEMAQTYKYLLTSGIVENIIAKDLGSGRVPAGITAEVVPETNLLILKATSRDPDNAYATIRSVLSNYSQISNIVMYNAQMTLIEEPVIPIQPVNPPYYISYAEKGAFMGGILGIILVVFLSSVRRTVLKSADIKTELNMQCIGIIPEVILKKRSRKKRKKILITNDVTGFGFREAFRALRTKLEISMKDKKSKVILVTSALPNEGKTCIAVNLALALAQNSRSVVLIDGDLRNPSVTNAADIRAGKEGGILEVLSGKVPLDKAMIPVEGSSLSILPGTEASEEAPEKLASRSMEKIIEDLRGRAEYIIIDTAPAGFMTDAAVLASYADGIVMAVKQDYAKIYNIMEAMENLSDSHTPILGCVMNNVKSNYEDFGYGVYGKYGKYGKYGVYGGEKETLN